MIATSRPAPGILQVTISRGAKRNALDATGFRQLAAAWDELEHSDARVAVLTGDGVDFSSGADLSSIAKEVALENRAGRGTGIWTAIHRAVLRDQDLTKPVVVAVEGVCFGAGMELVGGTDVRVAGTSARFALPEVRHGVVASGGSLARLPRQLPYAVAMEIMLTGREKSASELAQWGYVNHVVDDGAALETALDIARQIAGNAPRAVRAAKHVISQGVRGTLAEAFSLERATEREIMRGEEAREGARAFAERRPPTWQLSAD